MSGTYILGYMLKIDVNHVGTFKSPGLLPGEANIWNVADAKLLIMLNYWLNELSVLTVVELIKYQKDIDIVCWLSIDLLR